METKDINGREVSSRVWSVYDSVEVTLEDARQMTHKHYPDHEVVDFQTNDCLFSGGAFKASWLSRTREE